MDEIILYVNIFTYIFEGEFDSCKVQKINSYWKTNVQHFEKGVPDIFNLIWCNWLGL